MLQNTSGGSAITPIGEADLPNPGYDSSAPVGLSASEKGAKARVFQGGNHWDLHKMLNVNSGAEVGVTSQTRKVCSSLHTAVELAALVNPACSTYRGLHHHLASPENTHPNFTCPTLLIQCVAVTAWSARQVFITAKLDMNY